MDVIPIIVSEEPVLVGIVEEPPNVHENSPLVRKSRSIILEILAKTNEPPLEDGEPKLLGIDATHDNAICRTIDVEGGNP